MTETIAVIFTVLNFIFLAVSWFLQWKQNAKRIKSGEALDWSTAANNLRKEIDAQSMEIVNLRAEMNTIKNNYKSLQELSRRFVKELAKRGEPIILSPEENSLLYETGRFKGKP